MRIAIFSDVHGNPYACQAVLHAIAHDGAFDHVVAAGDLCFGGSDPAGCVDMLQAAGVSGVYGNTEVYILRPEKTPRDDLHLRKWDKLQQTAYWNREKLGETRLRWLATLPLALRFSPADLPVDDLLVVHAHPRGIEGMIYPSPAEQLARWGKVWQPDDDAELAWMLEGVAARNIVFGHFHYTTVRIWNQHNLINVAPCSMPAKDKDPRARYTILAWEGRAWQVTRRYVVYDYRQEVAALQTSGMPDWESYAATFE